MILSSTRCLIFGSCTICALSLSVPKATSARVPIDFGVQHDDGVASRRSLLKSIFVAAASMSGVAQATLASAAVTDETDTFAIPGSAYGGLGRFDPAPSAVTQSKAAATDEVAVSISKSDFRSPGGGLGVELADIQFRTNRRIYVKSIRPESIADRAGIPKGAVLVSIDGVSAERTNAEGAAIMVSRSIRAEGGSDTLELRFRDPAAFQAQLSNLSVGQEATTQVAPAGDTTQRNARGSVKFGEAVTSETDQKLTVSQIVPPKLCKRGADVDDLLEISYIGMVVETGAIFDGSAIKVDGKAIPGRGDDTSLFFVLGKQPFGQFPAGWDAGLEGICVGERRRIIVPPVLAYGSQGIPRRGIPPNATLQYDISLISINGNAMPQ